MADQVKPEVGMGATRHSGSDRYPYTVTAVLSPTRIQVKRDNYRRTDTNGHAGPQEYEYTPDPDGPADTLTLRRNGRWVQVGEPQTSQGFTIGVRRAYQDPSF